MIHPAVLAAFAALAACATTAPQSSCPPPRLERWAALLPLGPDAVFVALGPARLTTQDVACLAETGDKPMQHELGVRLAAGDGVPVDLERAEQLFAAASRTDTGMTAIYVPPACLKCAGQVMMLPTGPARPGLPQAGLALARLHLEGRAVRPDYRRGLKMLRALVRQGYPPAVAYYAGLTRRRA